MNELSLIVLARAVHVLSGVAWAGATFIMAGVVAPLLARHAAEGAGRWLSLVGRRAARVSLIAALLTIVSGIYLFATLHHHDDSASARVLAAGAVAALLSLAVTLLIGRPAGQALFKLQAGAAEGAPPSAETQQRIAALRQRAMISGRVTAGCWARRCWRWRCSGMRRRRFEERAIKTGRPATLRWRGCRLRPTA